MKWGAPFKGEAADKYSWHKFFALYPVHTAKLYGTGGYVHKGGRWVWMETVERRMYGCGLLEQWEYREVGDGEFTRNGNGV